MALPPDHRRHRRRFEDEITAIGATTGTVWADPGHDPAGNMTTIPQPAALADSFTAVYDAWNRLVRVTNDADNDKVVAEYEYDARNFRIVKKVYDDGSLDETRYAFFSESWQILEERVDGVASTDVEVQYVWGGPGRYIDELICRDRDTTANGVPNERVYALQDANFNVVALIADDGTVLERYRFTPYGQRTVLNANFTVHADPTEGGYAFVIGHQGLTHDIETGFIDNRHRFIVPPLGRFGQRDPLNQNVAGGGYQDGMGLYEYVGSNAVRALDPSGLCSISNIGGIYYGGRHWNELNCQNCCDEAMRQHRRDARGWRGRFRYLCTRKTRIEACYLNCIPAPHRTLY